MINPEDPSPENHFSSKTWTTFSGYKTNAFQCEMPAISNCALTEFVFLLNFSHTENSLQENYIWNFLIRNNGINFVHISPLSIHLENFLGKHTFTIINDRCIERKKAQITYWIVCLYYPYNALHPYMDQAIVLAYHISDPG